MLSTQLHETEHWRRMVSALEANARDFSAKLAQLNDDYDKACQDRDSLQREVNGFRSIGDSPRENNVEHFTATPIRD
jgi:hypothetical protein